MKMANEELTNVEEEKNVVNYSYKIQGSFVFIFLIFFGLFLTQNSNFIPYLIPSLVLIFIIHNKVAKPVFSLENLQVTRKISKDRIIEGKEVEVTLIVKNTSSRRSEIIELLDDIPEKFNLLNGLDKFLFFLNPHETLKMSYSCKCDYLGIFQFNSLTLIHKDYLGVTNQSISISENEMKGLEQEIIVIPKLEKLETLPVALSWLKFYNGNFKSINFGEDSDFRSVRKFQYGDSLRSINWKKTAQYQADNELFSNTFNVDKAIEAEIIYDSTYSSGSIWVEGLRQSITLSEFLLRNRNKVGLTIMNQYPARIRPKFGKRHLKIMIDLLMQVDSDEISSEDIITLRLDNIMRKFDPSSVIIIISPFLNQFVFDFAIKLKNRRFKLIAITPMAIQSQIDSIKNNTEIKSILGGNNPILQRLTEFGLLMDQKMIETRLKHEKIFQIKWKTSQSLESAFSYVKITY